MSRERTPSWYDELILVITITWVLSLYADAYGVFLIPQITLAQISLVAVGILLFYRLKLRLGL